MVEKTGEISGRMMKLENETHEDIGHHVQPCILLSSDSENSPQSMMKNISVENKSLENIPKVLPGKRDYQRDTSPTGRSLLRSFGGSPVLRNTRVNHGWTPSTDASPPCATLQVLTKIWKKQEPHIAKFEGFKTFDIYEAEARKKIQAARRAANRRVAPVPAVITNAPVPQNDPYTASMPKDAGKERQKKRRAAAPSPAGSEGTHSSASACGGSDPLSKKIRIKKKDSSSPSEYCQVVMRMEHHHQQHGSAEDEEQHAVGTSNKKRSLFDALNAKIPGGLPDEWARAVLQRSDRDLVRGDSRHEERGHHHHHHHHRHHHCDVPLDVAPKAVASGAPKEVIQSRKPQGRNEEISKDGGERDAAKTDELEQRQANRSPRHTHTMYSPRAYSPTPSRGENKYVRSHTGPQKGGKRIEEEEEEEERENPSAIWCQSPGEQQSLVGDDDKKKVPLDDSKVEERKNPNNNDDDEGHTDIHLLSSSAATAAACAIGNDNLCVAEENPRREEEEGKNPMLMMNHTNEGKNNILNTNTNTRNKYNEENTNTMATGDIPIITCAPGNTTMTSRKDNTISDDDRKPENATHEKNQQQLQYSPSSPKTTSTSCAETDEENPSHATKSELHKKMHALLDQVHGNEVEENVNEDEDEEGSDTNDGKVGKNESSIIPNEGKPRDIRKWKRVSRKPENAQQNANEENSVEKTMEKKEETHGPAHEDNTADSSSEDTHDSSSTSSSRRDDTRTHRRSRLRRRVRSESRCSFDRYVSSSTPTPARCRGRARRASFASSSISSTNRDSRYLHFTTRPRGVGRQRRRSRSRSHPSSSYSNRQYSKASTRSRSRSRSNRRSSQSSSSESESSSISLGAWQEARKARRAKLFVNWDKKPHNLREQGTTDPAGQCVHGGRIEDDVHPGGRKSRDLFVTQLPLKGVALIPQLITFFNFMFARIPAYKEKYVSIKDKDDKHTATNIITRITMSPCETYVFVGFLNDELASTALCFDNALFLGRPIKIRYTQGYVPSPLGPCPALDVRSLRKQQFLGPEGEDMTRIIKKMRELYVGNIGPTVTSEMLYTLFTTGLEGTDVHKAHIGPPVEGVKLLDRFAFITFQSPAVATAAMEVFHNYVLEMSALRIRRPSGYLGDVIIDIMDSVGVDMDLVTSQAKAQGIYAAAVFFRADSDK